MSASALSLLATLVALAFAFDVTRRAWAKRRPSDALFAVSLYMFSLAAFGEFVGGSFGWSVGLYKLYYFTAVALVAYMAAGTLYARDSGWAAHAFLAFTLLASVAFLIALLRAPVDPALVGTKGAVGGSYMPREVRMFSPVLSGIGALVLLVSALANFLRTRRRGFLAIFSAALVLSAAGALAKYVDLPLVLPASQLVGIALYYWGVVSLSVPGRDRPEKERA
ncbi:hypothetical protein [Brockia lithotrophica]|uniref:Uncharacterized protein n=1 Tax=Brockia lithotrophica TaxID=933949 RepID=A0A660KX11_9BACL|nr:hypothetical protein [Brockia lithotrophica]RKQ84258.1 hypothetical protein C7438_1437 [Brockia lithotrophica]